MPPGYDPRRIERIVAATVGAERHAHDWDVAIAFVSDDELQALHRDFMDDDTPTDIMTFPRVDDGPWMPGSGVFGGDIAISVDRAAEQCVDEGWVVARELEFLVVHGMLHLMGWDDTTPEDRARMLDRQREILTAITG
jgi:probable rRNA maturation factor